VERLTVWVVEFAVGHWMVVGVGVAEVLEVVEVVVGAGGDGITGTGVLCMLEIVLLVVLEVAGTLLEVVVTASCVDEEVCEDTLVVTALSLVVLLTKDDDSGTDVLESAEVEVESASVAGVLVELLVKLVVESLERMLLVAKVG